MSGETAFLSTVIKGSPLLWIEKKKKEDLICSRLSVRMDSIWVGDAAVKQSI